MKTLLCGISAIVAMLAMPALAADLPLKAPPQVAPPQYNWSGFYLGLEGGWAWGRSRSINADPATPTFGLPITDRFDVSGGLFGGTIGYNWQFNNWVAGLEGDFSWVDKSGSANDIPPFNATTLNTTTEHWLGTGRVRFGLPFDRWLVYGTGGFAVASVEDLVNSPATGLNISQTVTRWGWTAGAGIEAAIGRNWSAKLEYLFVGLQDDTYLNPHIVVGPRTIVTRTVTLNDNIIRGGINYRF
jgi:outer membrane immunogenic protein